ncbi:MAG: Uma2 family endonuclease [Anaerolineae bacterium]|nr:Uma2 family endonuclease [Anaerolineae bacterium]MCA9893242.1 Uma2 family endonuclease [Anaerolineae bacterium]
MALPKSTYVTEEEYLAFEQDSEFKNEYSGGEIIAMTGASREHIVINHNVSRVLGNQLVNGPCEVYSSEMRVQIQAMRSYRYPDIAIVCGEPAFVPPRPNSLLNPTLIIEILSDSTTNVDRVDKLAEYRRIPSLQEYLLISQDAPRIERYLKQDEHNWLYTELTGLDQQLALPSIDCVLQFSDVFHRIDFDTPSDPSESPE